MARITAKGYKVLLSSPWYLNYIRDPYQDFWHHSEYSDYKVEPLSFLGNFWLPDWHVNIYSQIDVG